MKKLCMTNKILFFSLLALFFISFSQPSYAAKDWFKQWETEIKGNSHHTGTAKYGDVNNGSSYGWLGGGYKFTTPYPQKINLMNITPPKLSMGCGGIDFNFGGFNLISMEQLGEFLKGLVMNAPTYLFEMGLQILCPSCVDIMNTIQGIAGALNGLQLDSCAALDTLSDMGAQAGQKALMESTSNNKTKYSDYASAMKNFNNKLGQVQQAISDFVQCVSSPGNMCPKNWIKGEGSLMSMIAEVLEKDETVKSFLTKIGFGTSKDDITMFLQTLFGDVAIKKLTTSTPIKGTAGTAKVSNVKEEIIPYKKNSLIKNFTQNSVSSSDIGSLMFINKLIFCVADASKLKVISKTTTDKNKNVILTGELEITTNQTFNFNVYNSAVVVAEGDEKVNDNYDSKTYKCLYPTFLPMLKNISEVFQPNNTGNRISESELELLNSMKAPVYKILNEASIDSVAINLITNQLTMIVAPELTYNFMSLITETVTFYTNRFQANLVNTSLIDLDLQRYIENIISVAESLRFQSYKVYQDQFKIFEKAIVQSELLDDLRSKKVLAISRMPGSIGVGFSKF